MSESTGLGQLPEGKKELPTPTSSALVPQSSVDPGATGTSTTDFLTSIKSTEPSTVQAGGAKSQSTPVTTTTGPTKIGSSAPVSSIPTAPPPVGGNAKAPPQSTSCTSGVSSTKSSAKKKHAEDDASSTTSGERRAVATPKRKRVDDGGSGAGSTPARSMPLSERQQLAMLREMEARDNAGGLSPQQGQSGGGSGPGGGGTGSGTGGGSSTSGTGSTHAHQSGGGRTPQGGGGKTPQERRVNKRNERGETHLHTAAIRGDLKQARSLLEAGADVGAKDFAGWTPLHEACYYGHARVARLLLRKGADVAAQGLENDTPLHDSSNNGHPEVVSVLIRYGANPYLTNSKGQTALILAADAQIEQILRQEVTDPLKPGEGEESEEEEEGGEVAFGGATGVSATAGGGSSTGRGTTSGGTSGTEGRGLKMAGAVTVAASPMELAGTSAVSSAVVPSGKEDGKALSQLAVDNKGTSAPETSPAGRAWTGDTTASANSSSPGFTVGQLSSGCSLVKESGTVSGLDSGKPSASSSDSRSTSDTITTSSGASTSDSDMKLKLKIGGQLVGVRETEDAQATAARTEAALEDTLTEDSRERMITANSGTLVGEKPRSAISVSSAAAEAGTPGGTSRSRSGSDTRRRKKKEEKEKEIKGSQEQRPGGGNGGNGSSGAGGKSTQSDYNTRNRVRTLQQKEAIAQQREATVVTSTVATTQGEGSASSIVRSGDPGKREDKGDAMEVEESQQQQVGDELMEVGGLEGGKKVPPLRIIMPSKSPTSKESMDLPYVLKSKEGQKIAELTGEGSSETSMDKPMESTDTAADSVVAEVPDQNQKPYESAEGGEEGSGGEGGQVESAETATALRSPGGEEETKETPTETKRTLRSHTNQQHKQPQQMQADGNTGGNNEDPMHVHPRKRKLRSRVAPAAAPAANSDSSTDQAKKPAPPMVDVLPTINITNPWESYSALRKKMAMQRQQIERVPPRAPPSYHEYLTVTKEYILDSHPTRTRFPLAMASTPAGLSTGLTELFNRQERERYKVRRQHIIEKERLIMCCELEVVRVFGRASRAAAGADPPVSVCSVIAQESKLCDYSTPSEQQAAEKDKSSHRTHYNNRQFLSWLQDVEDKFDRIKKSELARHRLETNCLVCMQREEWEIAVREETSASTASSSTSEDKAALQTAVRAHAARYVAIVEVCNFDLLPESPK